MTVDPGLCCAPTAANSATTLNNAKHFGGAQFGLRKSMHYSQQGSTDLQR